MKILKIFIVLLIFFPCLANSTTTTSTFSATSTEIATSTPVEPDKPPDNGFFPLGNGDGDWGTRYEFYDTGGDDDNSVYGDRWHGQSWTPTTTHTIKSVVIHIWREGSPETLTLEIYATDGSGNPTGSVLASGTTSTDGITTSKSGDWYRVVLDTTANLSPDVKYCHIVKVLGGNPTNKIVMLADGTFPTYPRGNFFYSTDAGSNWNQISTYDYLFEEWGEPYTPPTLLALIENVETGTEFIIRKTFSYGRIIIIFLLVLILVFEIMKFLVEMVIPQKLNFRK